jgi:hypothetical protein
MFLPRSVERMDEKRLTKEIYEADGNAIKRPGTTHLDQIDFWRKARSRVSEAGRHMKKLITVEAAKNVRTVASGRK